MDVAWKTPQFWLLWAVLCLNVTAGIGILGQASLMCQDMFGVTAAVGGGFAGLLSLFNMGGRFFWSSLSDLTGRKAIYCVYFLLGAALYCLVPFTQKRQSVPLFVLVTAVIISMYGGGFATIPAYLRDLFGTMHLGAIHGRLITAWSMAAVLGPQLVNYISDLPDRARRAQGRGLQPDHVPDGRPAAGRPGLQPAGPPGRRAAPSSSMRIPSRFGVTMHRSENTRHRRW